MSKRRFSAAERWAIFSVHGERCYLGAEPINLFSMEVDHIIPEWLEKDPERLAKVIQEFGLPSSFEVNSYENWLPACGKCNNRKHHRVFVPTPIIQAYLEMAAEKAELVREVEKQTVSHKRLYEALNVIERAHLPPEAVNILANVLMRFKESMPNHKVPLTSVPMTYFPLADLVRTRDLVNSFAGSEKFSMNDLVYIMESIWTIRTHGLGKGEKIIEYAF